MFVSQTQPGRERELNIELMKKNLSLFHALIRFALLSLSFSECLCVLKTMFLLLLYPFLGDGKDTIAIDY